MAKWPATRLIKLNRNFRSDATIVKAAAALIAKNPETYTSTASHCFSNNKAGSQSCIASFVLICVMIHEYVTVSDFLTTKKVHR